MADIVPILCPRCRSAAKCVEVGTVTDGPGVRIEHVGEVGAQGGDNCAKCPECGTRVCWRVLTRAA